MIGRTISHYKIVAQIGVGGMGIVYEAEDLTLRRRVAIKTLKELSSHGARLLKEAQAVSDIAHPSIATLYEYGETEEGQPYIVMELVKGKPLDEFIRDSHLNLFQIIEIVIQVARALSAAHERGIIHRDIKPSNILIHDDHSVKVLDFGLSKQLRNADETSSERPDPDITQTMEGVILGTPLYLSPEQALGKSADERSDIFSLGSLLYECVTGRSPFSAPSVMEICDGIKRVAPPPPSKINPGIPVDLDNAILKALAKKPGDRYQTMAELIEDLDALQTNLVKKEIFLPKISHGLSDSISQRLPTSFRDVLHYPYLKVLVFVLMAVVGIGAILFVQSRTPYRPNSEAQKWYDRGVTFYNDGTFYAARNFFEKAANADGSFALARARLAESLSELGYLNLARKEREQANETVRQNLADSNIARPSREDELRMQAINSTLSSDFPGAVKNYEALVYHAPKADKAQALLDLGRAYERHQKQDEALKAYEEALSYDSNLPSANVRLAVLQGRRLENDKSAKYFSQAEELYKVQNNSEGEIEVTYQRGLLISSIGDASIAREETEKALKKAEINEIPYQHVKCLLLMSRILRSSSQSNDALHYIEKAIPLSLQNNLEDLHARSLLELGTVYLFLDKRSQARTTYEEALVAARKYNIAVTENRVLIQLGALSLVEHDHEKVLGYIEQVRGFFEQGGYKKDMLDLLSIEAQAVTLKGDQRKALAIYTDLLARAEDAEDVVIKARAQKGVGTILANIDELTRALPQIYQSYSLHNSIHKTLEAGYALVLYADILAQLGRYGEADTALNQAEGLAQTNAALTRRINLVRAKRVLSGRNFAAAIQICRTMTESDPKLSSPSNLEAQSVLALAYSRSGERSKAEHAIGEIELGSRKIEEKEVLGKIYLIRAEIMLGGGKNDIALDDAIQAQRIFKELEKPSLEWQAWALLSKAQTRLNQVDPAKASLANADVIFSTLAQKWGEDFKTYSERPDLKVYH
jgi:serine/threonine protein kinase